MNKIILIIGINCLLNLILFQNLIGQYCYVDSINHEKYQYNQNGKLELIYFKSVWFPPIDSAIHYEKLHYNNDNLLESIESYTLSFEGDTLNPANTDRIYEYENGLLSKINWYNDAYYDDFVWEDNKLMEYKYYYFWGDTIIDSSQTRILQFTYLNNNIRHFLYYEIASGEVYADYFISYDTKINPYYQSELSLVDGDLLEYSSLNNWKNTSSGMVRTITYNTQNYPIYIYTDWNNGNFSHDTINYDCPNSILEDPTVNEYKLEFLPNPTTDIFIIKSNINQNLNEVKIFDLNGLLLVDEYNSEKINVQELKPGIYIVECHFGEITLRKKIIIYTS